MTAYTSTDVVIGTGSTVTIKATTVKKNVTKKLTIISPPTSTGNWTNGVKPTKILDLLKIESRFTVTGFIDSTDMTAMENYVLAGGTVNMAYAGSNFAINFEKYEYTDDPKSAGENDERSITFTAVIGVNI